MTVSDKAAAGGWLELFVTLAIQAMASMAVLTMPVVAPVVGPALGISQTFAGLYIGIVYVGAVTGSLSAGAAVQRWGPVRVSQGGLALGAFGLALCTSGYLPLMAAGSLLMGLGYGPITPASSHLLARSVPPHRMSLMFSLKQTGVPLGGILAGALVPGLMLVVGWRWGLGLVALVCLGCSALAQPLRARLDAQREPGATVGLAQLVAPAGMVVRHTGLRAMAVCSFFFSAVQLCLTTYTVIYLHSELGFGLVAAGLALSVSQFAGVVGRVIWGHVADSLLGAKRTLALLAFVIVLCCGGIALITSATPLVVVLILLAAFGATAIGWNGVFLAEVARLAPAGQASGATGGVSAFTFFGVVVGPPLFALIATSTGSYRAGYAALALPMAWCCVSLWRGYRKSVATTA
ncbi:MAG: major facilitator superfamily 1 [Polaromonas sp.]|nr:major facilitator superfamily 1 [Polaromonas sp.]